MMKNNTTELLSVIVKAMSEEGIELYHVDLNEKSVGINNKFEVGIALNWGYYINEYSSEMNFHRSDNNEEMIDKVLELLTKNDWLPGDDIEAYGEWFTLVIEEDNHYTVSNNEYCSYRLLDENYSLSERMTLEDLKNNYTNASLEQGRLK